MSNQEIDTNFKVPLTTIREIKPFPNVKVERLLLSKVFDFEVVIGKFSGYNVGDPVIYCPIASVLPHYIEEILFPPDSKIKLEKSRIRAIRIQGFVSQGMIIRPSELINGIRERIKLNHYSEENANIYNTRANQLEAMICYPSKWLGKDLQDLLGIKKYEPPQRFMKVGEPGAKKERNKKGESHLFRSYNGCTNIKWCPDLLQEGVSDIYISEKLHGSSWRVALLPTETHSIWQRIKKFFGLLPKYTFCYGSNNVQLHTKPKNHKGFYDQNYYLEMVEKYDIRSKLLPNEMVFAELIGGGNCIQKNYNYGLKENERRIVVFDLMYQDGKNPRWATFLELVSFCQRTGLEMVPVLYRGKWDRKLAESLVSGVSVYSAEQPVREGIVIKNEFVASPNEKIKLKWINPQYLLKEADGSTSDGDG